MSDWFAVGAPGHEGGDAAIRAFDRQARTGPQFDSPDRPKGTMTDLLAECGNGLAVDGQRLVVGAPLR